MTWFDLVKSSEMKEFEMLAEKYAKPNDMKHLDYLRKKHGKKSQEYYETLDKQIVDYLTQENDWRNINDIVKGIQIVNPNLKYSASNLQQSLYKRMDSLDVLTKQESGAGRNGKITYYKV